MDRPIVNKSCIDSGSFKEFVILILIVILTIGCKNEDPEPDAEISKASFIELTASKSSIYATGNDYVTFSVKVYNQDEILIPHPSFTIFQCEDHQRLLR